MCEKWESKKLERDAVSSFGGWRVLSCQGFSGSVRVRMDRGEGRSTGPAEARVEEGRMRDSIIAMIR